MKEHYPKEEDLEGAYIMALELFGMYMEKQI
jgi:hypothetical protein